MGDLRYADAGVDIDEGDRAVRLIKQPVTATHGSGAEPLLFLDYFATGRLSPERLAEVVGGAASACGEAGCALVGGETAELPGLYALGDFDIAGFIVGCVERDEIIDGHRIEVGDSVLGLPSSGLHTNGYSLVRHILAEREIGWDAVLPGTTAP